MKMSKYINVEKQLVRLYLLGLSCEDVVRQFLLTAQTADVVEVVRCKECKHREYDDFMKEFVCDLDAADPYERSRCAEDDEWFCADGAKMDEVEELSRYIDADKMADELSKVPWYEREDGKQAVRMVKEFPAADVVEVRHGRMVIEPDATVMHCNVCGWAYQYYAGLEEEWNYCPNCGALMKGDTE